MKPTRITSDTSQPAITTARLTSTTWRRKAIRILRGNPWGTGSSGRRLFDVRDPVPGTLHGVQQGLLERLVDRLAEVVEMAAERVGIRQPVAPDFALDFLAAHHARRFAHQDRQQLQADRRELQ